MTYLTTAEAAERLRCHRSLIFGMIRRGKLPSYRVGGKVLLKTEEVDALVVPVTNRKSNNPNGPKGKNLPCPNPVTTSSSPPSPTQKTGMSTLT